MAITRTKIFSVEGQSPIVLHNVPQSVELVGDIVWKDEEQTIIDDFTVKIKTKDEYSTGVPHKVIKRVDTLNITSKTWTEGTQETYEAQEKEFTLNYKGHERDFEVTFDEEGTPVVRYRWSMNDAHDLTIGGGASVETLPLGGKIFYIDSNDNGATYHFYKEDGSEIEGWTDVASLADAVSYSVEGEPTTDKFYVYYPTEYGSLKWGYDSTSTGATGTTIGTGKTNTATIMALTLPSSGTIWNKLSDVRTSSGLSDWFVPSKDEIDKFIEADLETWARKSGGSYPWSSSEYSAWYAWYWHYANQGWYYDTKGNYKSVFFVRAF